MKNQFISLLALASGATATFQWLDAVKFSCPANTDNTCVDEQKSGFGWEGLDLGSFTNFGKFEFDGFKCADSFDGKIKRDHITGRTFQNKCIKATVTPEKSPSFGCGTSKEVEKFSVKTFQVSVEYDTELEFEYDMPDGSVCKQKQSCKKSGTTVKNTQCGGATKVKVKVPKGTKKSCDVGFHHIDFDCDKAETPSPTPDVSTSTSALPVSETTTSAIEITTESSSAPPATETPAETTSTASETENIPVQTPPAETTSTASPIESTFVPPFPANTTTAPPAGETLPPTTLFTTSVFTETHVSTITSCGEDITNCPAGSSTIITETSVTSTIVPVTTAAPSTVVVVDHTTVIVETSTTICPVTATHVTEGVTTIETGLSTSTIFLTSTSTICTKCTVLPSSTPAETLDTSAAASTTTSSAPLPTADCPAVLPQCLNTWLFSSGCKSNTETDCFCKSNNFVDNVYKCLSAHGASDEEVDSAEKYFQGICAPHVPENPAIVTGVNTLTITASPTFYTAPVTTIVLQTTIVVPCTETAGPSEGSIIPGSSTTQVISTAITVPQVVFETITGSTNVVSLVQGPPTAVPATLTSAFTTPLVVVPTAIATFTSIFSNGTATASSSQPIFTGAASKSGMTAGSLVAAGLVALMAL